MSTACATPEAVTLKLEVTAADMTDLLAALTRLRRSVRTGAAFGRLETLAGAATFSVEH